MLDQIKALILSISKTEITTLLTYRSKIIYMQVFLQSTKYNMILIQGSGPGF